MSPASAVCAMSSSICPASTLDRSIMSLMRPRRWTPFVRIRSLLQKKRTPSQLQHVAFFGDEVINVIGQANGNLFFLLQEYLSIGVLMLSDNHAANEDNRPKDSRDEQDHQLGC